MIQFNTEVKMEDRPTQGQGNNTYVVLGILVGCGE